MNGEEVKSTSKEYVLQSWSKQKGLNPIPIAKAEGIYLYDFDGKRYTDMSSQLVNMNLGFGNKDIADAIKEQVDKYCYVSPAYGSEPRATLAKMIIDAWLGAEFEGGRHATRVGMIMDIENEKYEG